MARSRHGVGPSHVGIRSLVLRSVPHTVMATFAWACPSPTWPTARGLFQWVRPVDDWCDPPGFDEVLQDRADDRGTSRGQACDTFTSVGLPTAQAPGASLLEVLAR